MTTLAETLFYFIDREWLTQPAVRWSLTGAYVGVLLLIAIYGVHRYWLVYLYYRNKRNIPRPKSRFSDLPPITVQLPMFNEGNVAIRIIDAACAMEYPRHLLQVQVIDDSTDASAGIAEERCRYWSQRGINIEYIHRTDRTGFKAGALENAMKSAIGRFIAIFDADFVPPPNFLRRTVHYFTDENVGMVQAKWGHLNRDASWLTKSQAIFLDGHFLVEHTSRNRADRWINFNGTAGIWRKAAIESAGGWQHDTLTEDVDLSYRAQLHGWRFVYLPRLSCPAELPPEINAFKSQQHRWTKGSIQTAKKLLPQLLMSKAPLPVKVEAFFHLTSPMVYLYITLMVLLFYPAFYVNMQPFEKGTYAGLFWGISLFCLGTASAGTYYIVSQAEQKRSKWATVLQMPLLMSIGIGIAINNARGVIEALLGHESAFIRTPKYGTPDGASSDVPTPTSANAVSSTPSHSGRASASSPATNRPRFIIPTPSIKVWMSLLEIGMGLYVLECIRLALQVDRPIISVPFLALFASGYFYVGLTSIWSQFAARRSRRAMAPQPA